MAIAKTLRGADIKVFINGQLFPPATSLRFSATTGRHAIRGVDSHTPFELASGPAEVKGSIEVLRKRASGGLEGAGVVAPEEKILLERYFSLTVVDRLSDTVVLQIDEAALVDQNWSFPGRGIVTGNFSFEGLSWVNETAGI
jgi:hypothetical protein